MAPAISSRRGVLAVLAFGACAVLLAALMTLLIMPFVQRWPELTSWRVFRRCASIAAALSLWWSLHRSQMRLAALGFSLPEWRTGAGKRQFAFGCLLGVAALTLFFTVAVSAGACRWQPTPDHLRLWRTLLGFVPAALLVGCLEEAIFRGFILQQLLAASRTVATIASSALYSLVHLRGPSWDVSTGLEFGGLFLLGLVLAFSYLTTRRLYLAIGLHAVLAYGARVNKLLVSFPDPSLAWLVGTSRLVNGLVGWVGLVGLGAAIARWGAPSRAERRKDG